MAGLVKELQQVADRHADPLVALRKALRRYVEFGLKHPQHYQATFGIPHGHDAAEGRALPGARDDGDAGVRVPAAAGGGVRQAEEAGEGGRPHKASCALWAGVHGITSLLIVMPNFNWGDPDKVVDQLVTMLVDGLG